MGARQQVAHIVARVALQRALDAFWGWGGKVGPGAAVRQCQTAVAWRGVGKLLGYGEGSRYLRP
jgi:hypothetical protein